MIDILLLVFGGWAIITGKIPSWVIGGGKYKIEGKEIRFLGIFLVLMFPFRITVNYLLISAGIEEFLTLFLIDILILIGIIVIANNVVKRVRKPIGDESKISLTKE
jgi:hypothetical protein